MKTWILLLIWAAMSALLPNSVRASEKIADNLMSGNKIVAVVLVLVIILAGIFLFLWTLERRIKKMEKDIQP